MPETVNLEEVVITADRPKNIIDDIHDYSSDAYNAFGQSSPNGSLNELTPEQLKRKRIIQLSVALGVITMIVASILIYQHYTQKNVKK